MFYRLDQNNSGGYFLENDEVRQFIFVESDSYDDAKQKLRVITEEHSEYCECCGERWYMGFLEESETPIISGKNVLDESSKGKFSYIIYFKDGTIVKD